MDSRPEHTERVAPAGRRGSAAAHWKPLARFVAAEAAVACWAERQPAAVRAGYEFIRFGVKQGWACLFGGLLLALLLATHFAWPPGAAIARYDFLLLAALAIQATLLATGLETWREARVILVFHVVGTVMEVFKTAQGSWTYPEPSLCRIGGVPLFTGFMYAAVGSYLARVWRLFEFRFTRHPPAWAVLLLAGAIYANFFLHHFIWDARWLLFVAAALLFGRTWVYFRVWRHYRRMPLLLGLVLVSLFIWFAENIGTFARAWVYPSQHAGWIPVSPHKLGAWFLLMIISYGLVVALHERDGAAVRSRPDGDAA